MFQTIKSSNIHVTNSPFFLRLGAPMRVPAETPVDTLRRVNIINVSAYNADSHFSSITAGRPDNETEGVQLNNIRIWYRQIDSPLHVIQTHRS